MILQVMDKPEYVFEYECRVVSISGCVILISGKAYNFRLNAKTVDAN